MNYRVSRKLMWGAFVVGIALVAMSKGMQIHWIGVVGIICMFLGIAQALVFYRCPYCKTSLMDKKGSIPEYCPQCGKLLEK